MANYASLKAAIQDVVKTNGNNEITGALLQQSLLAMINSLGANYQFAGIATTSTVPGTPDQNIFYIAGAGTFSNFDGFVVPSGHIGIFAYNGNWLKQTIDVSAFPVLNVNEYNGRTTNYDTKNDARNAVPQNLRKNGLIITYLFNDAWVKEQFVGGATNLGTNFIQDFFWRKFATDRLEDIVFDTFVVPTISLINGYIININGVVAASSTYSYSTPIELKKGQTIVVFARVSTGVSVISKTQQTPQSYTPKVDVKLPVGLYPYRWTADEDCYVSVCCQTTAFFDNVFIFENAAITSIVERLDQDEAAIIALQNRIIRATETDFMKLDPQYNLFISSDSQINAYINGDTGVVVVANNLVASPFVPVEPETLYYIGGQILARYWAFFDENKQFISGGGNTQGGFLTQLQSPANAKYVRFTMLPASYQNVWFSENALADTTNKYTIKDNVVIPISVSTLDLTDIQMLDAGNIIDRTKLIIGAYINATTGAVTTTSQQEWVATDWCEIDPTKVYSWFKIRDFYAAFYDDKKTFIKGYSTSERMPNPVTPPANAKYARFTISNNAANAYGIWPIDDCWVAGNSANTTPNNYKSYVFPKNIFTAREFGANPCDYNGREMSLFNKLLCVGDSLMFGAENVASGSVGISSREPLYNIPAYIKKMAGIDTTNAAHSGYTAQQWYNEFSQMDLSGHDACIIQLGVNNWLSWATSQDTAIDDFKTAMGNIVDLIVGQNSYNDNGTLRNKIKIFVATIFPAKSYMKNSAGLSVDVLNDAIRSFVSSRNDCILLDMAIYSHTNEKVAFNRGHLTALGYRQAAQDYCGIIGKYIKDNLNLFVDVAFVGTSAVQYTYSPTEI